MVNHVEVLGITSHTSDIDDFVSRANKMLVFVQGHAGDFPKVRMAV